MSAMCQTIILTTQIVHVFVTALKHIFPTRKSANSIQARIQDGGTLSLWCHLRQSQRLKPILWPTERTLLPLPKLQKGRRRSFWRKPRHRGREGGNQGRGQFGAFHGQGHDEWDTDGSMFLQVLRDVSLDPFLCLIPGSPGLTRGKSPIQSVTPVMGGKVVLKLGVFEKVPEPEWEAFAVRRQNWEKLVEGCIQYKLLGGPGKEEL